jgi:hypothetical protein
VFRVVFPRVPTLLEIDLGQVGVKSFDTLATRLAVGTHVFVRPLVAMHDDPVGVTLTAVLLEVVSVALSA